MVTAEERPNILVVYATRSGSTAEVAEAVAVELRAAGANVDVSAVASDPDPSQYAAVVVGGPMIMGWHRDATRYITRHRDALAARPTAYFIMAASLTDMDEDQVEGTPIVIDPWLAKPPRVPGRLSLKERYARPGHYLKPVRKKTPRVRPVTVAFFAGCLDLTKLKLWEKLFVLLVIRATPGDGRHWEAIRSWAQNLGPVLIPSSQAAIVSSSVP